MQNRYVRDIGDFGKYGMLRFILSKTEYRLGINWYLVQDENHTNDGKFVDYLNPAYKRARELEVCDVKLYRVLRNLVASNKRSISAVQASGILPELTAYYADEIPCVYGSAEYQIKKRNEWFRDSLAVLKGCDILFLDPDNGMEVPSAPPGNPKSAKYVFYKEVLEYYRNGHSIIVYNHSDRSSEQEYLLRFKKFKELIGNSLSIPVLRFCRSSVRYYSFILQKQHNQYFKERLDQFIKTTWGSHCNYRHLSEAKRIIRVGSITSTRPA